MLKFLFIPANVFTWSLNLLVKRVLITHSSYFVLALMWLRTWHQNVIRLVYLTSSSRTSPVIGVWLGARGCQCKSVTHYLLLRLSQYVWLATTCAVIREHYLPAVTTAATLRQHSLPLSGSPPANAGMMSMADEFSGDDAVQATNDDAVAGKRCAVQLGYWKDPYLQFFCRNTERKAPEMNRGYYTRTQVIKTLIARVTKITGNRCQIVSLGAGFDTLYWRLKDDGIHVSNFTEVDFPPVTSKKCYCIKKAKTLLQSLASNDGDIRMNSSELHSTDYHLVAADIRNLNELRQKLKESEIDPNLPTIFLAECVLVYVELQHSDAILRWIADNFPSCVFINYEQVNMDDKFGSVMVDNLKARGCILAGVEACASLSTQEQRFTNVGWDTAHALNMVQVYNTLPTEEIHRIEKLEFLDERELMEQLFLHYCICIATKDGHHLGLAKVTF